MNRLKTKAFTLAEVLVTLMIIGVISALTIPSLKESADKSANKAALQKAYATASNAFASLKAEYGPPMYWLITSDIDNSDEAYESGNRVFQTGKDKGFAWMLQKKINIGQAAGIPPAGYQIKTLSGSNFVSGDNLAKINNTTVYFGNKSGQISFQSADNMFWFPSHTYANCNKKVVANGNTYYLCGLIVVDTNGAKEPNRMGVDVFVFDVTPDGVIPHLGEDDEDDCKDMSGNGYTCAAKLINGDEHALDFIYE